MKPTIMILAAGILLLAVAACNDESQPTITRIFAAPSCGVAPLQVEVYGIASGGNEGGSATGGNNNLDFTWDFGDGVTSSTSIGYHTFAAPGEYVVTLRVEDTDGKSATRTVPVVVIQDNRTTAMTGGQENPGTGHTLLGVETPPIDMEKLVVALGVVPENVRVVSAYNLEEVETALKEELAKPSPSVVITKDPCVLQYRVSEAPYRVDLETCTGCKQCIRVGCIALSMTEEGEEDKAAIDPNFCTGCSVCAQVCKFDAIVR